MSCLCYHGDLSAADREEKLGRYRLAGSGGGGTDAAAVLVCTDIASRGLDVPQVDHVVMFDFPLNPIDYLHRTGRVARRGGWVAAAPRQRPGQSLGREGDRPRGEKRDRVLVTAIEGAVQRGESLEGLSSRKSDYAQGAKLGDRALGAAGGGGDAAAGGGCGGGRSGRGGRGGRSGRGGRGGRGRGGGSSRRGS